MQRVIRNNLKFEYLQRHADLVLQDKLVGKTYRFEQDAALFWNKSNRTHELFIFFNPKNDELDLFDTLTKIFV